MKNYLANGGSLGPYDWTGSNQTGEQSTSSYNRLLDNQAAGGSVNQLSSNSGEFNGRTHEEGGIKLPDYGAEVEDKETIADDYIFSDRLGFADVHRKIAKSKGKIEAKGAMTPERVSSLRRLDEQEQVLKQVQELTKQRYGKR